MRINIASWRHTEWSPNLSGDSIYIAPVSNSYIIKPKGQTVYIPVSRCNESMLGEQLSPGEDFSVELVWTDNEEGISARSNIKSICKVGGDLFGYIRIESGDSEGNAVVAIKKDGVILWSWHIWVSDFDPEKLDKRIVWMDRNLGAIGNSVGKAATKGLLYQWGRKDPFPGSTTINGNVEPTIYNASGTTSVIKTPVATASNFPNSVRNPLRFYYSSADPYDWYTNTSGQQNEALWGSSTTKSIYDPCPYGWRVPTFNGSVSPWDGLTVENFPWNNINSTYLGRNNDSFGGWYPAAGYRIFSTGELTNVGERGYYWSASPLMTQARHLYFTTNVLAINNGNYRVNGYSVRCVRE